MTGMLMSRRKSFRRLGLGRLQHQPPVAQRAHPVPAGPQHHRQQLEVLDRVVDEDDVGFERIAGLVHRASPRDRGRRPVSDSSGLGLDPCPWFRLEDARLQAGIRVPW
ncbi:MAG: hypothetical protein QM765_36485 [Myxococcales bacterium]